MNSLLAPQNDEPRRVTLSHIGLASFTKWQTLAFFVLGIFAGIIYTTWFAVAGQITGATIVWYFLVTALMYAVLGLIWSLIFGLIYNSVAVKRGGVQFDVVVHDKPVPPPPPERWEGTLPKVSERDETPVR